MDDKKMLDLLIETEYENDFLDFKMLHYKKENKSDMLIDILAMANSEYIGDKYIILGMKVSPDGERNFHEILIEEFQDSADIQQLVLSNIEPDLKVEYFPYRYKENTLAVLKILGENISRPYMLKKDYKKVQSGMLKIRKGSTNANVSRTDLLKMFSNGIFEVKFMDKYLAAVNEKEACARTSIAIKNHTNHPVVIRGGEITVFDNVGNEISHHRVYGFKEIVGADFQLAVKKNEDLLGDIFVGFTSNDCLRLEMDKDDYYLRKFVLILELIDIDDNIYKAKMDDCIVFAKDSFCWKADEKRKKNLRYKQI